jgi:chemosensory pili system protein ChpA (sensor histidine kinase/response regulator)
VNIEPNIVASVIEEAISCLPAIRKAVASGSNDPAGTRPLEAAFRDAQSIKGAASMIGEPDVYELAKEIEVTLRSCAGGGACLGESLEKQLMEKLDELEILLLKKKVSLPAAGDIPGETAFAAQEPAVFAEDVWPAGEDFEVDPETLEIFSLEADDLLRNIGEQLKLLTRDPARYEALMEVRRSAHTLKGSAAIIGMKALSSLAHRMEDLLDFLTEHKLEPGAEVHLLLAASTDCLAALAHGESTEELHTAIDEIYLRYDVVMSSLQSQKETFIPAAGISADADEDKDDAGSSPAEGKQARNSVIRISLERLDDLMRLFSEVLQARAAIEQRLSDMEKQVQELQHSTGRLRHAAGKLEIDFEAGMMKNSHSSLRAGSFDPASIFSAPAGEVREFDELEFDRYTEFHQVTRQLVETGSDVASINIDMEGLLTNLESAFTGQRHLIDEIQKRLMQFRMVQFDSLARRLQRTVRITAEQEEKLIELVIEGGHLEVDTQILDSLIEPLLHILRNAVSHGIEAPDTRKLLGKPEQGVVHLRLSQEGTFIALSVSDDGRGIQVPDLREKALKNGFVTAAELAAMSEDEILSLVFLPGLSTSAEVSEVSGRGVGMNIVKENLARYQGTVSVASELQKGTVFTLRLPMALSAMRALLVEAGREVYALPLNSVRQIVEISHRELEAAKKEDSISLGGVAYRLTYLNELLNFAPAPVSEDSHISLLLLKLRGQPCALAVDELLAPQEIVLKPLCFPLENLPGLLGASILGNGRVMPVLDLPHLLKQTKQKKTAEARPRAKSDLSVMLVDDSPSVRRIMSAVISGAGWQVLAAKDGIEAFEMLQNSRETPNVILTDVEMPRMDGYELLATLKRHDAFKRIPVIIITSRAGEKHRRKALDLGVSEYVTKPYEDSVLLEIIKRLAGQ